MFDDLETVIGLVPGQGGYRRGCLDKTQQRGDPVVMEVFEAVDDAAAAILGQTVTPVVFGDGAQDVDSLLKTSPALLQMATYGVSATVLRLLEARDVRLSALLGHSLGEIAALVGGGAFTVRQGAEIVAHRSAVLKSLDESGALGPPGTRMVALACSLPRVRQILDLLSDAQIQIAAENGAGQTVVSGPQPAMRRVIAVATAAEVSATPLVSPYPFHNALLSSAAKSLTDTLRQYEPGRLHTPVYSPIAGRFYRDGEDLAQAIGRHLLAPVRFGTSLDTFRGNGASIYVEVGAADMLTKIATRLHPSVTCLAPLAGSDSDIGLRHTADFLRGGRVPAPAATAPEPVAAAEAPSPPTPAADPVADTGGQTSASSRDDVLQALRTIFAEVLEYPEEVFTEDAELEGELGIDSLKQTELLSRLRGHFGLPLDVPVKMNANATIAATVDLILDEQAATPART